MSTLAVSLSQVQTFRRCEQMWAYQNIEKLRPRVDNIPMERGSMLHTYLELFYGGLMRNLPHAAAHESARAATVLQYQNYCTGMAQTARMMGSFAVADEFTALLPTVLRIAGRYYQTHGQHDAAQYDVLAVEKPLRVRISADILSNGVADLVTRERSTGQIMVWEHKSTKQIPSHEYRLRDVQTTLYIAKLQRYGIAAQGVIWNYLRTVEPRAPKRTGKTQRFSTAAIDSTWDVYRDTVLAAGEAPLDYEEMEGKLADRETTHFFPRYEILRSVGTAVLLQDYRTTALAMHAAQQAWQNSERTPVRNLSRECDHCLGSGAHIAVVGGKNKNIEEVVVGDRLLAYDGQTYAETRVIATASHTASSVLRIKLASGQTLTATAEHPFHLRGAWQRADTLRVGDELTAMSVADFRRARMRLGNPMENPAARASMGEKHSVLLWGRERTEQQKEEQSARMLANDSANARKARQARQSPLGDRELDFVLWFREAGLPIQHTGRGGFWIGRRNPDFRVIGQKKVIEIHSAGYPAEKRREYETAGYKVLVLNDRISKEDAIKRAWEFINNGDRIVSISRTKGEFAVFDLSCAPHQNFFANRVLTHNCTYSNICTAVLAGTQTEHVARQQFTTPEQRQREATPATATG